jgi:hypothetical protein
VVNPIPASAQPSVSTPKSVAETEAVISEAPVKPPTGVSSDTAPIAPAPVEAATVAKARRTAPPRRETARSEARGATASRRGEQAEPVGVRTPAVEPPPPPVANGSDVARNAPVEPESSARLPEASAAPVETPPAAPDPPAKIFDELVVSPDSVIGLQIEHSLTSETARVEDRVEARVTRDVKVGDRVAIPAGSRMLGSVTEVERGGKVKERARLGVRFHTLVLADGMRVPVSTDTLFREGVAPGNESAAKIGGAAIGGAILGAVLGGGKGAATGAAVGAAGGTAAVVAGGRNPATLTAGTTVTVRVLSPITITRERDER